MATYLVSKEQIFFGVNDLRFAGERWVTVNDIRAQVLEENLTHVPLKVTFDFPGAEERLDEGAGLIGP
jgi:hypothetical protein